MTKTIIVQNWIESERGWGQRPDGYSIHLTNVDRAQFIQDYWAGMPDGPAQGAGPPPDEYSAPSGVGELIELPEDLEHVVGMLEGTYGARLHSVGESITDVIREWAATKPAEAARPGRHVPPGGYAFDPKTVGPNPKPVVVWQEGGNPPEGGRQALRVVWHPELNCALVEQAAGIDALGDVFWHGTSDHYAIALNHLAGKIAAMHQGLLNVAKEIRRPPSYIEDADETNS